MTVGETALLAEETMNWLIGFCIVCASRSCDVTDMVLHYDPPILGVNTVVASVCRGKHSEADVRAAVALRLKDYEAPVIDSTKFKVDFQ